MYAAAGTPVFAVEAGVVQAVRQFTGPELGHTWGRSTFAVFVMGATGLVVYGEITPDVACGTWVSAGQQIGRISQVRQAPPEKL